MLHPSGFGVLQSRLLKAAPGHLNLPSSYSHIPVHPRLPCLQALPELGESGSNPGRRAQQQHADQQSAARASSSGLVSNNVVPSLGGPRLKQEQQRRQAQAQQQGQQQTQQQPQYVLEPMSKLDVDQDLWQVLDLCSDEELESIYELLYAPSPFSPVVKSLVAESEPALLGLRGRLSVMHKVEARFRFLAADSASLLHGRRPSYRETLLSIRQRMDVPCSANLDTYDLETEVFLHILKNCVEYVQGEADLTDPQQAASAAYADDGDGMGYSTRGAQRGGHWTERLTAPFRFGLKELAPTLAKLGSAMTLTAVGRGTAQQLAAQLISSHLKYQAALRATTAAASQCGGGLIGGWSKRAVLDAAQKGLTSATARYSAIQGALAFLGPVMWGWLALDLAYKAIGTDYARVIRAVFILAQVRLVSTGGFIQPPPTRTSDAPHAGAPQQPRQQWHTPTPTGSSSAPASSQEVVMDGDAGSKGMVHAVAPYGYAAAGAAAATAAAAGGWEAAAAAQAAEEAEAAAALEMHPHRFRHLLDCSEDLCDDDADDCLFYGTSEEDEDPFTDSVC